MKANEPTESEKCVAGAYVLMHRKILEFLLFMGFMLYAIQAEEDKDTRVKLLTELADLYNNLIANYVRAVGAPAQGHYSDFKEYATAVIKHIGDRIESGGVCSMVAEIEKLIAERKGMCETIMVQEVTRAEATEYRNRN